MCGASAVVTGASVIGSALGMANSLANQKAQRERAMQEQLFRNEEAKNAQEKARQTLQDSQREQEKIRLEQKALQSKKATEFGAGNVSLQSGSALTVLSDMAEQGELLAKEEDTRAKRLATDYQRQAHKLSQGAYSANPFQTADTIFSGISNISNGLTKNSRRGAKFF